VVEEETASAETPAATAWSSASGKAFGHATVDALSSVPSQPLASGSHMEQDALHALIVGFVGYIIGLGDRHGSNILVDQLTWGALHIDFGDVSRSSRQDTARS